MIFSSEQDLVEKARSGNHRAWLKLVKRHEANVYHYGLRMTQSQADAMDLLQDVFMSVYRHLDSWRGDGSLNGWIMKIAHHRCIEMFRRQKPTCDIDAIEEPMDPSQHSLPDTQIIQQQTQESIIKLLSILPWEQREVIELKFFQHLKFEEIAETLAISSNTAKSRLYNGLKRMKAQMEVQDV